MKEGYASKLGFLDYVTFITKNSGYTLRFRGSSSFSLGTTGIFGYFLLLVHFLGFLTGGLAAFAYLSTQDMCSACALYLRKVKKKILFFQTSKEFNSYMYHFEKIDFGTNNFQKVLFNASQNPIKEQDAIKYYLRLKKCPSCQYELLKGTVHIRRDREWKELHDHETKVAVPTSVSLEEKWEN